MAVQCSMTSRASVLKLGADNSTFSSDRENIGGDNNAGLCTFSSSLTPFRTTTLSANKHLDKSLRNCTDFRHMSAASNGLPFATTSLMINTEIFPTWPTAKVSANETEPAPL